MCNGYMIVCGENGMCVVFNDGEPHYNVACQPWCGIMA